MAPPRAFKRYDSARPSHQEPPDLYSEFPKESDVYPELSREVSSPKDRFEQLREALRETRSNAAPDEAEASSSRARYFTAAAVGIGLLVGGVVAAVSYFPDVPLPVNLGGASGPVVISESTATLTSTPDGADVYIDGIRAGKTPISLSLPVGVRVAELRIGQTSRRTSLSIEAGKITAQHVDLGGVSATGGLEISSEPAGARVSVDGRLRGQTPLKIPQISPGQHRVTISSGRTSVERTVEITAGATATIVVSVPAGASAPGGAAVPAAVPHGWIAINAPIDLEVFEAGRQLGSGSTSRISLPIGPHTLEFVNRSLRFRAEATVSVEPGRSVALDVPMPNGRLSINALPWADVWVDGRSIGQTPIGNVTVSLGTHEIVWRHPQHGERRQLVLVTAAEPYRLGIDWTR